MAKVDKINPEKGNPMIAEFMKTKRVLQYHKNWNALMPVVNKLENKGVTVHIHYKNTGIDWMDSDFSYEVDGGIQGDTKIDATWTAIVYFLDWLKEEQADLDNPVYYE